MKAALALALAALALLAGCAGPQKMYAGQAPDNLLLKTRVDPGSATRAEVALDIHRMESRCKMNYEGRVWLDEAETRIGLPVDQPMFLSFAFASFRFMSRTTGTVRQETTFVARPGYTYVAEVNYVRGIYEVQLRETRPGFSGGRTLELRPPPPC